MAFLSNMLGGMDFSSLYGNMATQQQQMMPTQPTTYQGQIPSQQPQPQQMDRASMLNMIQGLF